MPINPLPLRHWTRNTNAAKSPARNYPKVLSGRIRHVEAPVTIELYGKPEGQQKTLAELLGTTAPAILWPFPPVA